MNCCNRGQVHVPSPPQLPQQIRELLFHHNSVNSKRFYEKARLYNSYSSFASVQMNYDQEIMNRPGPPTIRINGSVAHRIGPLQPQGGRPYTHLQAYFHSLDGREDSHFNPTERALLYDIKRSISAHHTFYQELRMITDQYPHLLTEAELRKYRIEISATIVPADAHRGIYNAPTCKELAMIIQGESAQEPRTFVIYNRNNYLEYISSLHPAYDCLSYAILLPHGTLGESSIPCFIVSSIPDRHPLHRLASKWIPSLQCRGCGWKNCS